MINEKAYKFSVRDTTEALVSEPEGSLVTVIVHNEKDSALETISFSHVIDILEDSRYAAIYEHDPSIKYITVRTTVSISANTTKSLQFLASKKYPDMIYISPPTEVTGDAFCVHNGMGDYMLVIYGDCEVFYR